MPSVGPRSPGTGSNNTSIGSVAWSSTGNITSSDDLSAVTSASSIQTSNYLQATNFGFSSVLPAGSTIDGILVEVERRRDIGGFVYDNSIRLRKSTGYVGSNKANTSTDWPTTDTYASYGGSSDLWGTTWTYDEVTHTDFGVGVSVSLQGDSETPSTARVDHVRMTITYTPSSGYHAASQILSVLVGLIAPLMHALGRWQVTCCASSVRIDGGA